MVSSIYASILALFIVWLSLNVIKLRRSKKIKLGDGGETDLQYAIRAHGNATEYIPISLILLILLELSGISIWLVHLGGVLIIIGRIVHAKGLLTQTLSARVLGMQITIFNLIGLAVMNIAFMCYKLLGST